MGQKYTRCCAIDCYNNTRNEDKLYCSKHRCKRSFCNKERVLSGQYCEDCICTVDNCDLSKYDCWFHRCRVKNCNKKKMENQHYCIKHICLGVKCWKACLDDNEYCLKCWIKNEYYTNKNEPNYLQKLPWELLDIILFEVDILSL